MAEQRVSNLEEMDQQEAHIFLDELFSRLSAQVESLGRQLRPQDSSRYGRLPRKERCRPL
jgi:hypothetical protein